MADISRNLWSRGQTDLKTLNSNALQSRLAETIAWCNSLTLPNDLPSFEINPNIFHQGYDDIVCDIGFSRQRYLGYNKIPIPKGKPNLAGGRLLVYYPDLQLSDGAAEVATDGFFDVFNLPPFDTWLTFIEDSALQHMHQKQLLCYIPASAVHLADLGISVNPEECILWLEDTNGATKNWIAMQVTL